MSSKLEPLNSRTGNPVTRQFVNSRTGDVVAASAVVRGYKTGAADYVTISDSEYETLAGEAPNIVEVAHFCPVNQVDRVRLEASDYIYPDGQLAADTLESLRLAMRRSRRDALAYIRIGERERMALIQVDGAGLMLSTLRPPRVLEAATFAERPESAIPAEMIEIAESIITRRSLGADANALHDRYEDRLRSLLEQKTGGGAGLPPRPAAAPPPPVPTPSAASYAPPTPEPPPASSSPFIPPPFAAAPPPRPAPEPPEPAVSAAPTLEREPEGAVLAGAPDLRPEPAPIPPPPPPPSEERVHEGSITADEPEALTIGEGSHPDQRRRRNCSRACSGGIHGGAGVCPRAHFPGT